MKANQIIARFVRVLDDLDKKGERIPGLILSHPGYGKTSTIRKYCEYMDYNLTTLIPSQSSSDDIVGLQSMKDGNLVRLTPSWYNKLIETAKNGKRNLLFIDEISAIDSYLSGPLLDLIFSRSLGEAVLPENTFIVAAGNYSEDLNNSFRMTAPLVNRFMLLNLWNKDYSVEELLGDSFESVKTKQDIEDFFDLKEEKPVTYDIDAFKSWIKDKGEVRFGKSECIEDPTFGLMGFTSIRSLSYSLKFAEAYMNTYKDNLWMRVVGDTLGVSEKREGKLMRVVLEANAYAFTPALKNKANKVRTLSEICDSIIEKGLNDEDVDNLKTIVENISAEEITSADLKKFTKIAGSYFNDDRIRHLNNILTQKMQF